MEAAIKCCFYLDGEELALDLIPSLGHEKTGAMPTAIIGSRFPRSGLQAERTVRTEVRRAKTSHCSAWFTTAEPQGHAPAIYKDQ